MVIWEPFGVCRQISFKYRIGCSTATSTAVANVLCPGKTLSPTIQRLGKMVLENTLDSCAIQSFEVFRPHTHEFFW